MDERALKFETTSTATEILDRKAPSAPTIMQRRRMFRIIDNNEDLTPDDLIHPDFSFMDESFTHAGLQSRHKDDARMKAALSTSKIVLNAEISAVRVLGTTINLDDIRIDHTLDTETGLVENNTDLERAPSAFYTPKMNPLATYISEFNLTLKETPTTYLFELPMLSFDKGTRLGTVAEEDNEFYEYITVGKGRNRKMVVAETQTEATTFQTRHTQASKPQKKNVMCFASMWDIHDTYALLANKTEPIRQDDMVLHQCVAPTMLRKKKRVSAVANKKIGKTYEDIALKPEFFDATLITERVLASKDYSKAQKIFRGLTYQMDPLSLDLVYIYTMNKLWTFECPETEKKTIASISFNPKNRDILAAGYGKFTYAENCDGMVCIWCTKNPCKPERVYRFQFAVTSVSFSTSKPNHLACGFWNGDVLILDITSHTLKAIASSNRETNPSFEPIWVTYWFCGANYKNYVMTCCQDGRINKFLTTKTGEFLCTPIMRVCTAEGKLKGIKAPKTCINIDVPISRHPGVLCLLWHQEINHLYYVGTDEGCVHKCSTNYLNQHIDVFQAHAGPVYDIRFCPLFNRLFITGGADGAVRLWIDGLNEMILTLNCPYPVHGVTFCPKNATIIVNISGNQLLIWDIRRKTHEPCRQYTFPGGVVLTCVDFDETGANVLVSDTTGKIHTFHLEDTPISPYNQHKILSDAIRCALCTRPHTLEHLNKLKVLNDTGE